MAFVQFTLIRNVLISGCLLYPVTFVDLFPVDWKIPDSINIGCFMSIVIWGRGTQGLILNDQLPIKDVYDQTLFEWFPIWFDSLNLQWKLVFLLFAISFIIFLALVFNNLVQKRRLDKGIYLPVFYVCYVQFTGFFLHRQFASEVQ